MSTTERKPLRADARRNRERVLAAARELFAKHGPEAQIDEIAAHAKVGVGTVYRHFPTKEALLTELVRVRFQDFTVLADAALEIEDPYEALATVMRESCRAVEHDAGFQLAMMGPDQLEWEGVEEDKARVAEAVGAIMARGVKSGALRADLSFDDFPVIMCGLTATMHFEPGGIGWERHLELLLGGLRGPAAR